MKTFRFPAIICALLFAAFTVTNAQPTRTQGQAQISFLLTCMNNDFIYGPVTYDQTTRANSRIQLKLNDAVIKGRQTSFEYTLSFSPVNLADGDASSLRIMTVKLEGKLVARLPVLISTGINGEVKLEINPQDAKCS